MTIQGTLVIQENVYDSGIRLSVETYKTHDDHFKTVVYNKQHLIFYILSESASQAFRTHCKVVSRYDLAPAEDIAWMTIN